MAIVAQLVRAPACGAGGRRFESGLSPHFFGDQISNLFNGYSFQRGGIPQENGAGLRL